MRESSMSKILILCVLCGMALGCSGGDDALSRDKAKENVFSAQTKVIDKAKSVDREIGDAAARQRQAIEDQDR